MLDYLLSIVLTSEDQQACLIFKEDQQEFEHRQQITGAVKFRPTDLGIHNLLHATLKHIEILGIVERSELHYGNEFIIELDVLDLDGRVMRRAVKQFEIVSVWKVILADVKQAKAIPPPR